uniref:Secreted protein n=1 Tax=Ascaris lumbricoides TaxID=6252 RepID=A0A0M3I2E8_ASCLU
MCFCLFLSIEKNGKLIWTCIGTEQNANSHQLTAESTVPFVIISQKDRWTIQSMDEMTHGNGSGENFLGTTAR